MRPKPLQQRCSGCCSFMIREQESPETFGVICGGLDTAPFFHVDRFPGISREMPFNMKRSQDPDPEQGGVVIFQVSRLFTLHLLHCNTLYYRGDVILCSLKNMW